ncbi:hypothetical protein DFH07DRAFT_823110 [Mycena maculata]|uniref:F-box domain-containing protein n=1 Tax=Mycena maculata TaxID=230809 RepID=A0AAD7NBY7_9AGAR|nr:hypothetical protein DFH07DRAFT_823110 [Mycena maculata]
MPSRLLQWTLSRTQRTKRDKSQLDYHPLTSLPNELVLAVLETMDDTTLHLMAAVSKRFYHLSTQILLSRYDISPSSGYVTITSSAALRALRIAMTLHQPTLKRFNFIPPSGVSITKDIRRIEAFLRKVSGYRRIRKVSLDFGRNVIKRPVGWTIGGIAPRLMAAICGDSPNAVFVAANGLFTCKPKSMLLWSPYARDPYSKVLMHDGSRQWVPSIRSLNTLDATYPVCTALVPHRPWTLVIVNSREISELLLSIQLSAPEWSAILSALTLPKLREVGIWAETIASAASTPFLNRHAVATLRYMSPIAERLPYGAAPLCLPKLRHLIALSHYVVHTLHGRDADALFPKLEHVELWPDTHFHAVLRLLSSHVPIQRLTLWMPPDFDAARWPVFPGVDVVHLNKSDAGAAGLRALLAHAFPALRRLHVNHSFEKGAIRQKKLDFLRRIALLNTGLEGIFIDGEIFQP